MATDQELLRGQVAALRDQVKRQEDIIRDHRVRLDERAKVYDENQAMRQQIQAADILCETAEAHSKQCAITNNKLGVIDPWCALDHPIRAYRAARSEEQPNAG